MKLYDIWLEYEKNPNDAEVSKLFCRKIQSLSKRVLSKFRLKNVLLSYEDLLQQAYICFFEEIDKFDNRGTLEGFFLLSFRRHIIDLLHKMPKCVPYRDRGNGAPTPLELLIAQEFDKEIESFLTKDESELYNKYLKEGIFDCEEIAKAEKMPTIHVKWMIAELAEKIDKNMKEIYD